MKKDYHVVSFSGGKDSTAMLLKMVEKGMQVDCILFCDTGLEFPAMYNHIQEVEKRIGREITVVRAKEKFEYMMFDKPIARRMDSSVVQKYGGTQNGYGWPGPRLRWCTERLKNEPRNKYIRALREKYNVIEYVGLAADEGYRLQRKCNQNPNHRHPLIEWGMTESDCLDYCKELGFTWNGLYDHFKRVSCWCCPLQSLTELRKLYRYYPSLWEKLKEWDKKTWRTFRVGYSVEQLEIRFELEQEYKTLGKPVNNKAFFVALKERMHGAETTNARQSV